MEKFGSGPMGGTDGYSTHKCNGTYMEDSAKRDKVAEIERYQHYSERFDAHMNSAKLEVYFPFKLVIIIIIIIII